MSDIDLPDRQHAKPRARPEAAKAGKAGDQGLTGLQRSAGNGAVTNLLKQGTARLIQEARGGGRPLTETMSAADHAHDPAPGQASPDHDVANARVHDDTRAARIAEDIGAIAFTYGRDVFLGSKAPSLDSSAGKRVMRHELAHVRQMGDAPGPPQRLSRPSDSTEVAARRAETSPAVGAMHDDPAVHRQEEEEEAMATHDPAVHRQEEEEEAMATHDPAVHRQEEEEEAMATHDPAVHRQEEEEEAMATHDPAVHRQEEEEEAMATHDPAVHRQEEEEEAMATHDPAVHRQEEEEEAAQI